MSFIRSTFPYPARIPSWFAGHMSRSLRELPTLLENIDLVIEARDSRLPLTSINSTFDQMLNKFRKGKGKEKEKLVVYTKRDLAEKRFEEPLRKAFLEHAGQKIMFADTRSDQDVRQVLKHAVRIAKDNEEIIPELRVLVVGMPNVGKSSLLNALRRVGLRKGKAFRTGAEAGITKKLTGTVRIYDSPSVYVYDTPGVMVPYLGRGENGAEKGLKLALTAGIKESLFEQDAMVDYLLWKMNKRLIAENHLADGDPDKHQTYLSLLPLPPNFQPTDNLYTLLDGLSERLGTLKKGGEKDYEQTCKILLKYFREGKLGEFTLDDLIPPKRTPAAAAPDDGKLESVSTLDPDHVTRSQSSIVPGEDDHIQTNQLDIKTPSTPTPNESSSTPSVENELDISTSSPPNQSILSHSELDLQVSRVVKQYLQSISTSTSASAPGSSAGSSSNVDSSQMSLNQQKKADKRKRLEERDTKLRSKGINVPVRQYGNSKKSGGSGLGRGSKIGEAGKIARSRR